MILFMLSFHFLWSWFLLLRLLFYVVWLQFKQPLFFLSLKVVSFFWEIVTVMDFFSSSVLLKNCLEVKNLNWSWMGMAKRLYFLRFKRKKYGVLLRVLFSLWFILEGICPVMGVRPLRERYRSWGDEVSIGVTFCICTSLCNLCLLRINYLVLEWNWSN